MNISITIAQLLVWLVVGGIAGTLAGMAVTRSKEGYGPLTNLVVGLAGVVIGGFVFSLIHLNMNLGRVTIRVDQVVSAFTGSLVFIGLVGFVKNRM
jgi:uncharacterized membrane protein YeaQ/YmgE (transglycosylase-associated protein family)